MRELIVRPLGLVTRPNLYGQYPIGALSSAQNLVMRAPGIIEPAPATVLGVAMGAANSIVHALMPLASTVMHSWVPDAAAVNWRIYGNAVAGAYAPAEFPLYSTTGRITPVMMRDRVLVNSLERGVYVCDPANQGPGPTYRKAGFGQTYISAIQSVANGTAINDKECVGYTAIYKRVYSDGYEIVSPPAPIGMFNWQGGTTVNVQVTVSLSIGSPKGVVAGDIVELYRTNIVIGAVETSDPGTSVYKIGEVILTAAHIAAGFVAMVDETVHSPLLPVTTGEALYTNPGQQGLLGANRRPETCNCIAIYKGFAFYANIIARPQWIFKVPGAMSGTIYTGWNTATFRKSGIGYRGFTGTFTLGNPTVTAIAPAELVGVVPGQWIGTTSHFATTAVVQSVGATTITFDRNVTTGGVAAFDFVQDVFELNGVSRAWAGNTQTNVFNIQAGGFEVYTDLPLTGGAYSNGTADQVTWVLEPTNISTPVPITIRATNGQNFSPPVPEITTTARSIAYQPKKNFLTWSKDAQPEHVPVANEAQVGTGEIIAMESTRDALWIFCTDGLYRLSGAGGQWRLDTVDTTLVLSSPRASCVLREVVYCYTNQGFGRVTDAGFEPLSERIVGDLLPGAEYTETASIILERNEIEQEIVIRLDATQVYIYSTRENAYTTMFEADVTSMAYTRYPVSGSAALAFGRSPSGSAPRYELWNATASWLTASGLFQPVFALDPFTTKQWVDGTYVFSESSGAPGITPRWNGSSSPAGTVTTSPKFVNEGRVTFGVPRLAAIGNSLAPGFDVGARAVPTRLYALSLRFRQFGEQNLKK